MTSPAVVWSGNSDFEGILVPLENLRPDPNNARRHGDRNLQTIEDSYREHGQQKPLVVRKDGVIIAGNGQWEVARRMGWTHLAAVTFQGSNDHARAYALRDNRTAELADWDDATVRSELRAIESGSGWTPEDMGWSDDDILELEARIDTEEVAGTKEGGSSSEDDPVPEPPSVTKPGDLWFLGNHRVLCGDSMQPESIARVLGNARPELCFTSPPYDQQRIYKGTMSKDWTGLLQGVFGAVLPQVSPTAQVLVNLGMVHRENRVVEYWRTWREWMVSTGWRDFGWYVWDQGWGLPGDWEGRLAPSFEFLFHFNQKNKKPRYWVPKAAKSVTSRTNGILREPDDSIHEKSSPDASLRETKIPDNVIRVNRVNGRVLPGYDHPAAFPIELAEHVIQTWTREREWVIDPFGGAGTTLLAGERLRRPVAIMEIVPAYVDIVLARWVKETGEIPRREDGTPWNAPAYTPLSAS